MVFRSFCDFCSSSQFIFLLGVSADGPTPYSGGSGVGGPLRLRRPKAPRPHSGGGPWRFGRPRPQAPRRWRWPIAVRAPPPGSEDGSPRSLSVGSLVWLSETQHVVQQLFDDSCLSRTACKFSGQESLSLGGAVIGRGVGCPLSIAPKRETQRFPYFCLHESCFCQQWSGGWLPALGMSWSSRSLSTTFHLGAPPILVPHL